MGLVNGESETESELLHAQAHVWNHIFNFVNSMSLKCAVELGIPDVISKHGQPMTLSELVASLPVHSSKAHHVYRLMRLLVHSGFFILEKAGDDCCEDGYSLTQSCSFLLRDSPFSLRQLLLAMLDSVLTEPWHCMSTWFKSDDPNSFFLAHGRTFWDYLGQEARLNSLFNEALAGDGRLVGVLVTSKCKEVFKEAKSLVDVGGGTGSMARAIAEAFPDMNCTVLDLPQVVGDLQGSKNLNYVGGDMFEAVPPADAVLLKWILHDWSDEDCLKILKRCKEAVSGAGKEGKVIIIDILMDTKTRDDKSIETQLLMDMLMMVHVSGKERNEEEWAKLFSDAGFSRCEMNNVLGLRSLIEVFP